ncbi:XrtA/PEP-CTERM system TPR-repeat protein PrsT [Massilia sp. UBA6681]|uniref:XrtA/PEP-CTERM system TPR-repeat protein PrsT n=1 Tax=Massilia sp. UBA6681 TaxID=1946839 RepID=UPI0025C6D463|nr:XrtA/PEP-CTERM system TPR-repeat protein PrsT [Massilia sp. UBA6681]
MPRHASKLKLSAALLSSAFLMAGLSACSNNQSTETLLAEAKQYQQKGDLKAAMIQLKNAVAKSPEDAEARIQLGMLHLETGDAVSADKELRKARSLGAEAGRVLPLLGKANMLQGRAKELLDDISADQAKGSAPLLSLRGDALLVTGKPDEAKAAFEAALAIDPNLGSAYLGLARHAMLNDDRAGAERLLAEALAKDLKNPDVWMAQGSMLRMNNKADEAVAAYDEALKLKPNHRDAFIEKAYVEIGRGKFPAAKLAVEGAEKAAPGNLLVVYVRALYEFSQGKYAVAQESLQKILKVAPDHMPTLLLAGASEMNLGAVNQAEQHLRKYLESNPNNVYARKLLAQTLLKSSQPADAAAALAPALKDGTQDAQLLALAGQSYMQVRDFSKASGYLEKAAELAPKAAGVRTSLGISKLAQGDQARGLKELELATTLDPKSAEANVALIQTHMGLKQFDKALQAVASLEKQQPDSPQVQNLKGQVYLAKGDVAGARAAWDKAVALQPAFLPATANLARLDMQAKQPDAAKGRFLKVLEKDKNNVDAMTALAELALVQNRPDEVTSWLEKASNANPEAVAPALNLGMHYIRTNQAQKALTLARKLQPANPTHGGLLEMMGQAQMATKDTAGALETYGKLVNVMPKSPLAQVRLASVYAAMKNEASAASHLKRAVEMQPNFVPARIAQVDMAIRAGRHDEALQVVRELQRVDPKTPLGFMLEGDLMLAQRKPAEAVSAYEKAHALAPTSELFAKTLQALGMAGRSKEVKARGTQWLNQHPNDVPVALLVAESNLASKEYKPAITVLERAIKSAPNNPLVLNNLAWAYQQEKDPRALAMAEQAYKLAGNHPGVMDTLGWLLVEQGDTARALPLLQKAVEKAPNAPEIRYHLAVALHKSGDKQGARKEIDKALAQNAPFSEIDAARALLKTL